MPFNDVPFFNSPLLGSICLGLAGVRRNAARRSGSAFPGFPSIFLYSLLCGWLGRSGLSGTLLAFYVPGFFVVRVWVSLTVHPVDLCLL